MGFEITEQAKELIIDQGYDVSFGARPLKRYIQANIETLIAKALLENEVKPKQIIQVAVNNTTH